MDRRACLHRLSAVGLSALSFSWMNADTILKRKIPASGELLPTIGLGTWQTFDVGNDSTARAPLKEVLKTLVAKGGTVVDSSPMYGTSEDVTGDLSSELDLNARLFIATKVWTTGKENGIAQMNRSFAKLQRKKIDLMQIHNLTDWQTHLATLRAWKEEGRIRYLGITHYTESAYTAIENSIKNNAVDFLQINYSMLRRTAEERLFPLAQEKNVAVIINQPFEEGELFQRVKGRALPEWAAEFDCQSWGQFFLKFILAHSAVTCVIPGTSKPHHMADNLGAGFGKLPDENQRKQMMGVIG
ncbi:MAG TPA: aldo/keto reductase [Ohtaekwangia sp.]|uniref:aldo/keto reductase n=1 Tax=Ohtaekwangia sp. TaxID=2066019 RepID=UPI002F957D80